MKTWRIALALVALVCAVFVCAVAGAEGYPESAHPYPNDCNDTQTYTHPEDAPYLRITFSSQTQTESGYDYVIISDASGKEKKYDGTSLAGKAVIVNGNSFTIQLTSDSSQTYYGYAIDSIDIPMQEEYP